MSRTRSETARQKVLTAALKLIAEKGLGGFTVDAVAKSSGVAKTTIYRHWQNGPKLLFETIATVIKPVPTPDTGSLREDLITIHNHFVPMMRDPAMLRLMLGIMGRSMTDERYRKLKTEFMAERHRPLIEVIENAKARGELPTNLDPEFAINIIEGPFAARMIMRGEAIPLEDIPIMVDTTLGGLRNYSPVPSPCTAISE